MAKTKTYLAMPTYLGRIENSEVVISIVHCRKEGSENLFQLGQCNTSANCTGFNTLWCEALDQRDKGEATHFLMLHSDIVPQVEFLDKMHEIMARTGADILSAVSPIKDSKGLTSIALDEQLGDRDFDWAPRRLTMKEIHTMEPTFTLPNLLINTGLMLVDLRKDWTNHIWFHFDDRIAVFNGKRTPQMRPEDWNFSKDARKLGAKIWATREVTLTHHGQQSFPTAFPWGEWDTDQVYHCEGVPPGVLDTMSAIGGWFKPEEGALLYKAAEAAFKISDHVMEVGSFMGRSTSVLGAAAKRAGEQKRVFAVDPHEGNCGPEYKGYDTFETFKANMIKAGVSYQIVALRTKSENVLCNEQLGLLFIDGLHDYENVRNDYLKFVQHVKPGGLVAFHDYEPAYPGVMKLVDEEVAAGRLKSQVKAQNLMLCQVPGEK
jgi:predicted O-methyltransferase YrrM